MAREQENGEKKGNGERKRMRKWRKNKEMEREKMARE